MTVKRDGMKKSDEYTAGLPNSINIQGMVLEGRDMGLSMRYRDDWNKSYDQPIVDVEISYFSDKIMIQYAILYMNGVSYSEYRVVDTLDDALALLDGWYNESMNEIGKMKKSTATETMGGSYHSRIGIGNESEDAMVDKIETMAIGMEYMDEPWKGRLKRIYDDWQRGALSTKQCYDEISDIEYRQSVSIKGTKKMKKSKGIKKNLEGALVMVKDEWLNPGEPNIPYVVVHDYGDGRITMKPLPQYTRGRMISPEETTMAEYVRVIDDNIIGKTKNKGYEITGNNKGKKMKKSEVKKATGFGDLIDTLIDLDWNYQTNEAGAFYNDISEVDMLLFDDKFDEAYTKLNDIYNRCSNDEMCSVIGLLYNDIRPHLSKSTKKMKKSKHTLKLRAITTDNVGDAVYDAGNWDADKENNEFEYEIRRALNTNDVELKGDVWVIKTSEPLDKIVEFINDHGYGFYDFISCDNYDYYGNLEDAVYNASTKKSTPSIHDMIAQTRNNNNSLKKSRVDLSHISKSSERENLLRDLIRRKTENFPSANSEFWWSLESMSDVIFVMSYEGTDYGKSIVKYIIEMLPNYDFELANQEDGTLFIEDVSIDNRMMDLRDQPVLVTTMSEGSMSMTLGEAIDRFGIESEGDPNDYRLFARCPKLKGLCGPVYPNEGYIARYDDWEVYDMLTR